MKVLDLLRNHKWNMQALISEQVGEPAPGFHVLIQTINGFGLDKTTVHRTKADAYDHARTVLGMV